MIEKVGRLPALALTSGSGFGPGWLLFLCNWRFYKNYCRFCLTS